MILRDVRIEDVAVFFTQQLDLKDHWVGGVERADEMAFGQRWQGILLNAGITKKTILHEEEVAGYVAAFERDGIPEVAYWIGKEFRGQGLATLALGKLLGLVERRPLFARCAAENSASLRVLGKCGFREIRRETVYSKVRERDLEEIVLEWNALGSGR